MDNVSRSQDIMEVTTVDDEDSLYTSGINFIGKAELMQVGGSEEALPLSWPRLELTWRSQG